MFVFVGGLPCLINVVLRHRNNHFIHEKSLCPEELPFDMKNSLALLEFTSQLHKLKHSDQDYIITNSPIFFLLSNIWNEAIQKSSYTAFQQVVRAQMFRYFPKKTMPTPTTELQTYIQMIVGQYPSIMCVSEDATVLDVITRYDPSITVIQKVNYLYFNKLCVIATTEYETGLVPCYFNENGTDVMTNFDAGVRQIKQLYRDLNMVQPIDFNVEKKRKSKKTQPINFEITKQRIHKKKVLRRQSI